MARISISEKFEWRNFSTKYKTITKNREKAQFLSLLPDHWTFEDLKTKLPGIDVSPYIWDNSRKILREHGPMGELAPMVSLKNDF